MVFQSLGVTASLFRFCVEFQGKDKEAGPLYERSLAICEESFGGDHPHVAAALNNYAKWLQTEVRTIGYVNQLSRVAIGFVVCWAVVSQIHAASYTGQVRRG